MRFTAECWPPQIGHAGPVANGVESGPRAGGPRILALMGMSVTQSPDADEIVAASSRRSPMRPGSPSMPGSTPSNYTAPQLSAVGFLSPLLNRRRDGYGGPGQPRPIRPARWPRRSRATVGDQVAVWAKLNMYDGTPRRGRCAVFDVDEACATARLFKPTATSTPSSQPRQLAAQSDVPVPRRCPAQRVRRCILRADALGVESRRAGLPQATTRTTTPTSCLWPNGCGRRWRCR